MISIDEFKARLLTSTAGTVTVDETTFTGMRKKAKFIDVDYGEWWADANRVSRGHSRHPLRRVAERKSPSKRDPETGYLPVQEVQRRLDERFGQGTVALIADTYHGLHQKFKMIDNEFGEFEAYYANVMRGMGHPDRAKTTQADRLRYTDAKLEQMLESATGDMIKFVGPYDGMLRKCRFLDRDFGEFEAYPVNVIYHASRHPDGAHYRREDASIERHWKTGEALVCVKGWERKTVAWFNRNRIDFHWHKTTFTLSDGWTYTPDVYLPDKDLWIEIKGCRWPRSMEKWAMFHAEHPNSELWEQDTLEAKGIL